MASIRDLRGRIKSVGNIRQITRAMEMVASTKLRRFQEKAVASRPYSQEISGLVSRLSAVLGDEVGDRPLFQPGKGSRVAVLLVTSDRGLCGAYNSNMFRMLETWLRANPGLEVDWYVYGRKGYQYLVRRGREVERLFVEPTLEQIDYRGAARTARAMQEVFLAGRHKRVVLFYTAFESMVKYVPTEAPRLQRAARGAHQRIRQPARLDEERDRRGQVDGGAAEEAVQPQAPGEHHQGAARHRRRRRGTQVSRVRGLTTTSRAGAASHQHTSFHSQAERLT